jgi:hypothetical protein
MELAIIDREMVEFVNITTVSYKPHNQEPTNDTENGNNSPMYSFITMKDTSVTHDNNRYTVCRRE